MKTCTCKCEHWEVCPVCKPEWFDNEGNRLPPEPTPLQVANGVIEELRKQLAAAQADADTAWAQAHRLALELECLIMDTKDNATVSKWWDSAFEAMEEYHKLKPGPAEDAEAWTKMRKAGI